MRHCLENKRHTDQSLVFIQSHNISLAQLIEKRRFLSQQIKDHGFLVYSVEVNTSKGVRQINKCAEVVFLCDKVPWSQYKHTRAVFSAETSTH